MSIGVTGTEQSKSVNRIKDDLNPQKGGLTSLSPYSQTDAQKGSAIERSTMFIKILNAGMLSRLWENEQTSRVYNAFISESENVISSNKLSIQVSSWGECLWTAFNDDTSDDTDTVYNTAVAINSIAMIVNGISEKYGYPKIRVGIGLSHGSTFLSQISKKVLTSKEMWIGEGISSAEEQAARACSEDGTDWEICADETFFGRLPEERRAKSFRDMKSSKVSASMLEEYNKL